MTINEAKARAEKMLKKATVAEVMKNNIISFLTNYYGTKKDEDGNAIYDENYNSVIDFDTIEAWDETQAPLAKELSEVVEKAIAKWIES